MTLERAKAITLGCIILPDMILNWFLGIMLLIFPRFVDDLIGTAPILPSLIYQAMGILFLVFAAWQVWILRCNDIYEAGLIYAALMAEIPVIALTIALVFWDAPIYPLVRVLLWVGNIYMLFLGAWYFFLAYWISKRRAQIA